MSPSNVDPDHWQDALVGSALGLSMAYFAYRQYYPPVHSYDSDLPYPPRIETPHDLLPTHRRNESDRSGSHRYQSLSPGEDGLELMNG